MTETVLPVGVLSEEKLFSEGVKSEQSVSNEITLNICETVKEQSLPTNEANILPESTIHNFQTVSEAPTPVDHQILPTSELLSTHEGTASEEQGKPEAINSDAHSLVEGKEKTLSLPEVTSEIVDEKPMDAQLADKVQEAKDVESVPQNLVDGINAESHISPEAIKIDEEKFEPQLVERTNDENATKDANSSDSESSSSSDSDSDSSSEGDETQKIQQMVLDDDEYPLLSAVPY